MTRKTKGPGEAIDFGFDWSDQMRRDSDAIATSSWTVPDGITKGVEVLDLAKSVTTVMLSGGAVGQTYLCANLIHTTGGRVWERHLLVSISNTL